MVAPPHPLYPPVKEGASNGGMVTTKEIFYMRVTRRR
nr:MAG TPA: hypothetical protein [Caudoviricetes sp.]